MTDLAQRTDFCHVEMWTVVDGTVQHPAQILGRTTWTDLQELVTKQGGERLTYDLFDVPNADGTVTRYRAMACGGDVVNLRQLADLLNDLVRQGRGDYNVFVKLYGAVIDDQMQDILGQDSWVFCEHTVVPDGGSGFVILDARPEHER